LTLIWDHFDTWQKIYTKNFLCHLTKAFCRKIKNAGAAQSVSGMGVNCFAYLKSENFLNTTSNYN